MKTTAALIVLACSLVSAPPSHADAFGSGLSKFDIEFVHIGDPGNAADDVSARPSFAGSLENAYRIGKYEVSEQMIDKANALGGLGITKTLRGPNKPATNITWNEAARFINWLNVSSGSTPAYKFALQPGDVGYSANSNIELWTISDPGYNPSNLYRNGKAKYFLPSVDEWYKAAYFDAIAGVYYDYPTGSNSVPDGIDFAGDATFEAVFYDSGKNPQPNDVTDVGVLSPYGTAGQGGNVGDWQETDADLLNGPVNSSSFRIIRGGDWNFFSGNLLSSMMGSANPTFQGVDVGFRVASIPEPSTGLLGAMACVGMFLQRRR